MMRIDDLVAYLKVADVFDILEICFLDYFF